MDSNNLTRQAIRLAQREGIKRGRPLTRDEVLRLRVQSAAPRNRALVVMLGFGLGAAATYCYFVPAPRWLAAVLAVAGCVLTLLGLLGSKKYLDRELQKLGPKIADAVLTGILGGLT